MGFTSRRNRNLISNLLTVGMMVAIPLGFTFLVSPSMQMEIATAIFGPSRARPATRFSAPPISASIEPFERPAVPAESPQPSSRAAPSPSTVPPPSSPHLTAITITTCGGEPSPANFRSAPEKVPQTILGAVLQGQRVYLTGQVTMVGGLRWYEAIAPDALTRVLDAGAQNRLDAGQTGWIADCFVDR